MSASSAGSSTASRCLAERLVVHLQVGRRKVRIRLGTLAERRVRALAIDDILAELHPDARCALDFRTPFQLLIAVILSAQTTDASVNRVTPELFRRFPDAAALAAAPREELEEILRSIGFFRSKARSISETARAVVDQYGGAVPGTLDELVTLRGVGRKTANVVLGECFKTPGLTVDTHFRRLSQRMGLTGHEEPERIERDVMKLLPAARWTMFSHRMIWHGRRLCSARKPLCTDCAVRPLCPTGQALEAG